MVLSGHLPGPSIDEDGRFFEPAASECRGAGSGCAPPIRGGGAIDVPCTVRLYGLSRATAMARILRRLQRTVAIRVIRGYRTVSFEAARVLAGTPPWELEAESLAADYRWRSELRALGVARLSKSVGAEGPFSAVCARIVVEAIGQPHVRLTDCRGGLLSL